MGELHPAGLPEDDLGFPPPGANPVQNAALTGTRRLIVSNDPESIKDRTVKNLYGCKWSLPSGKQDFRLFLWHYNDNSGGNLHIVLRMQLSAGAGTVNSMQLATGKSLLAQIGALGTCLAKAQIGRTFDSTPADVALSTTAVNVQEYIVENNYVLGVVLEGTITVDQACDVMIWTESGSGASPWREYPATKADLAPVDPNHVHVRGWYASCKAVIGGLSFEANPPPPPKHAFMEFSVCEKSGQDNAVFKKQDDTLDPYGEDNKGCYGADLLYQVAVSNSGSQTYPLYIYAVARNNDGASFGAIKSTPDCGAGAIGLNPIKGKKGPPASLDYSDLTVDSTGQRVAVNVPVGGITGGIGVLLTNAGGAALPYNIQFSGLGSGPNVGPQ